MILKIKKTKMGDENNDEKCVLEIKNIDFDVFVGAIVEQLNKTRNLKIVNGDSKITWNKIKYDRKTQKYNI